MQNLPKPNESNHNPIGECHCCKQSGKMYDYPFCDWACRDCYGLRLETNAFYPIGSDKVKYPEFLQELKSWDSCNSGEFPEYMARDRPPFRIRLR